MGKIKFEKRTRSTRSHSFRPTCASKLHEETTDYNPIYKLNGKSFKKSLKEWLLDNGHLTPRGSYICKACLGIAESFAQNKTDEAEKMENSSEQHIDINTQQTGTDACKTESLCGNKKQDELTNELVALINQNNLSEINMHKLCQAIGTNLNKIVYEDSKICLPIYKDLDNLPNLDCKQYLTERPKSLITFLSSVTNIDIETTSKKRLNSFCLLFEQLYYIRNMNFIGAFTFSQNILRWSLSGSKTLQTIDGSSTAAGSVTSLKKVLKNSASNPNKCFIEGDVDVYFDNTQRVGKTGRVREGGTTPMNIATNVVFIKNQNHTNFQIHDSLKPGHWLEPDDKTADKINALENDLSINYMEPYRLKEQSSFIYQIEHELWFDQESDQFKDHVTLNTVVALTQPEKYVCSKCCTVNEKRHTSCNNCKYDHSTVNDRSVLYDVPCNLPDSSPAIALGEIIGVNPNSRETVKQVLVDLKKQCIEGSQRKWIRVGCDGVPYNIASKLIEEIYVCNHCCMTIDLREQSIEEHSNENPNCRSAIKCKLFDYVLLVPGAGHIELNLLRAVFSLTRKVFMERVADLLGFSSKAAKEFIIGCGNHHIAWQILRILIGAFGAEIFRVYVIECKKSSSTPSLVHFIEWKKHVINPNFNFYYDLVFKLLLGLQCFRCGIRQNNSKYMLAGRQTVSPIMYMGRHMVYQHLLMNDMTVRVTAPPEIQNFIERNESYSRSGEPSNGEGGDYITENENRALKSHLSPGVPSLNSWVEASRNDQALKRNREAVFERLSIKDPGTEQTATFNVELEVQMLRREIRNSNVLNDPLKLEPLMSLDQDVLHPDLVNFYLTLTENYKTFLSNPTVTLKPVFVTYDDEKEFNNVNNWNIEKIKAETIKLIDKLSDKDLAELYRNTHKKSIVKAKKEKHVQFYNEVKEALNTVEQELDLSFNT